MEEMFPWILPRNTITSVNYISNHLPDNSKVSNPNVCATVEITDFQVIDRGEKNGNGGSFMNQQKITKIKVTNRDCNSRRDMLITPRSKYQDPVRLLTPIMESSLEDAQFDIYPTKIYQRNDLNCEISGKRKYFKWIKKRSRKTIQQPSLNGKTNFQTAAVHTVGTQKLKKKFGETSVSTSCTNVNKKIISPCVSTILETESSPDTIPTAHNAPSTLIDDACIVQNSLRCVSETSPDVSELNPYVPACSTSSGSLIQFNKIKSLRSNKSDDANELHNKTKVIGKNINATLSDKTISPKNKISFPKNKTSYPKNKTSSPKNQTSSSKNQTSSPKNQTSSHKNSSSETHRSFHLRLKCEVTTKPSETSPMGENENTNSVTGTDRTSYVMRKFNDIKQRLLNNTKTSSFQVDTTIQSSLEEKSPVDNKPKPVIKEGDNTSEIYGSSRNVSPVIRISTRTEEEEKPDKNLQSFFNSEQRVDSNGNKTKMLYPIITLKYICNDCSVFLKSLLELRKHIFRNHYCFDCNLVYKNGRLLKLHVRLKHDQISQDLERSIENNILPPEFVAMHTPPQQVSDPAKYPLMCGDSKCNDFNDGGEAQVMDGHLRDHAVIRAELFLKRIDLSANYQLEFCVSLKKKELNKQCSCGTESCQQCPHGKLDIQAPRFKGNFKI